MKVRIKWVNAILFIAVMLIVATFGGFAGYLSFVISIFLPVYSVISIIYLAISWNIFAYHQTFSTDHPQKGERIQFKIKLANDGKIPLTSGTCKYTVLGKESYINLPTGCLPGTKQFIVYETEISCPYRGTYTAGIELIKLSTPLGIIQTEIKLLPHVFYVFPEICNLDSSIEEYAVLSGSTIQGENRGGTDPSIFEYTIPLKEEIPGIRIAWKRWASTGIPSAIVSGRAKSKGLTVILDLYSCDVLMEEKLAAEDLIISAFFSVIKYLVNHEIPVQLVVGSSSIKSIDSDEEWQTLFDHSTGILFNDSCFPSIAFEENGGAILFSCRPISDFFQEYEKSLYLGTEPNIFVCPPASKYSEEKKHGDLIQDKRYSISSHSLFHVADVRNGIKEVSDAFLHR